MTDIVFVVSFSFVLIKNMHTFSIINTLARFSIRLQAALARELKLENLNFF